MLKPKVVFDTNVIISGLLFGGIPRNLLTHVINGNLSLFISPPIYKELEDVLSRSKFRLNRGLIKELLSNIEEFAILVEPKRKLKVVHADEDDNRIVECAVEAQAAFIVTGDKEFAKLGTFRKIRILSVTEFQEELNL